MQRRIIKSVCAAYVMHLKNIMLIRQSIVKTKILNMRRQFHKSLIKKILGNCRNFNERSSKHLEYLYKNVINKRKSPKVWMKRRSNHWWKCIVNGDDFDSWRENFRMDKDTFLYIYNKLKSELEPKSNYVRKPISAKKKCAMAIYKLASCAEYRVVANQFGVHKTSVHRAFYQFCEAVVKVLLQEEIRFPSTEEMHSISLAFERQSGLPQVTGAIDGTHIPISPPTQGHRDFINRKGWPSIILQAVVDNNYRFMDITCKHPGCTHDASVLKDSFLYKNINTINRPNRVVAGKNVRSFLVGDPAYPLLPWIMKPFVRPRTVTEESFNVYLSKARVVVENAFGRLKGRWRILQKKMDVDINFAPVVVATCCVLHNIVEQRGVSFNQSWLDGVEESDRAFPQPLVTSGTSFTNALIGDEIRVHLKEYMSTNYPLLQNSVFGNR